MNPQKGNIPYEDRVLDIHICRKHMNHNQTEQEPLLADNSGTIAAGGHTNRQLRTIPVDNSRSMIIDLGNFDSIKLYHMYD